MSTWSTITWDTARAAGFVAFGLLTVSVALGLALSQRWRSPSWPRWATNDLHRYVTLLALIFTGIHTLAIWLDPFMAFGPGEVLIPLVSHYRPAWVATGIVASYLLLAIWLSERVQRRIGYLWWRRLHYLSFAAFALAIVHGVATGSDTRTVWALWIYGAGVAVVGGLLGLRLLLPPEGMQAHPRAAALGAALLAVFAVWSLSGPLRTGWNATANNGNGSGARIALGNARSSTASATIPSIPARASVVGRVRQSGEFDGGAELVIDGQLDGGKAGSLEIVLRGQAQPGGFAVEDGREAIFGSNGALACSGTIGAINGDTFTARCSGRGGSVRSDVTIHIDNAGTVTGTLRTASA